MSGPAGETHLEFYERWGRLARPYFEWQVRQFDPYLGRRVADVGCGLGNFFQFFKDSEVYLGFEIDEELRKGFCKVHLAPVAFLPDNADITRPEAVELMRSRRIDTVICINVLEHIEDDLTALRHMLEGVRGGGRVCLLVPSHQWLYGTLDALDGHFRRYTKKTILDLVRRTGVKCEVRKIHYLNFIGVLGWFLKGRILKEKKQADENYKLMNRVLPCVSFIESRIKPPIGMSLVLVLETSE